MGNLADQNEFWSEIGWKVADDRLLYLALHAHAHAHTQILQYTAIKFMPCFRVVQLLYPR